MNFPADGGGGFSPQLRMDPALGYADFLSSHHLEDDASAPFRYYNHLMNEGGPVADRLSGYASAIDAVRDHFRAT